MLQQNFNSSLYVQVGWGGGIYIWGQMLIRFLRLMGLWQGQRNTALCSNTKLSLCPTFLQYKLPSLSIHLGEVTRNPKGKAALLKAHSIIPQEQQNKGVKDWKNRDNCHIVLQQCFFCSLPISSWQATAFWTFHNQVHTNLVL